MLLAGGAPARADGTNSAALTPEQMFEGGTNSYSNWVELSAGSLFTSGSKAQAQQWHQLNQGPFGGISDLHLQEDVAKGTTFSLDGRGLFDEHDYKLGLGLQREGLGYLRFNYENFRTWYNGAGGFYPPTGVQYQLPNDALTLDRGEISFEAGLILKNLPKVTFNYTHRYRDGDKSSTEWGPVHADLNVDATLVRGLYPAFYSVDEKADIFQLDATHHIKATDFGLGLRYETGDLSEARNMTFWPGEPVQRKVTDLQGTTYDMLSAHAFSETWIRKNLFFSAGLLFANVDSTFTGNRIYGDDFDVGYAPNVLNGLGYFDLHGGANEQEYVMNLNLMATPLKHFTIAPSIRVQQKCWDANSSGTGTLGSDTGPFNATSDGETLDVRERIDLRYTGVTNWVFYGGGEWTEGNGNLFEKGGLSQINGIGVAPILRQTDDSRWFQKYFIGARWYPIRRVTVDVGGYYKYNKYGYNNNQDSTTNDAASSDRYPAYLVMQEFETYDGNARLTVRPVQNVTLVSRYEYQWSTVHSRPDAVSGLDAVESARVASHILAQNISWVPWSRLSLQAGFNYVLNITKTPAADLTPPAIQNAQNDYWTLNFNSGLVVDDKTDLNLGYFFYQADDYSNNSNTGVPFGAGAQEQGVTAAITRRLTRQLRLNLKYGFSHYSNWASGGHNDFDAHAVYSSLQYRF
jgi:hypothetical protein